jgi:RNA polymerase sigma factor (sigma-70 family)
MPPPAEGFAARIVLGPALRTQPDKRLVALVREGYEAAFEEIVRRYDKALGRYAAAIVGSRSEDVTQDAFSKALLALRRDDAEIELRPWLYRIVRNTALNDLRDRPAEAEVLAEAIASGSNPAEELEQREELTDLMKRLRALPESQRAAIVMRELEGLSHEEIAAALGLSGGAARQAIHRARTALRDGAAILLPLPLMRFLIDHGTDVAAAGAGAGTATVAGGAVSGAGAGTLLKAGVMTAVLAGSVGTGVALRENRNHDAVNAAAAATVPGDQEEGMIASGPPSAATVDAAVATGARAAEDHRGQGQDTSGPGGENLNDSAQTAPGGRRHGRGPGPPPRSGHHGHRGPGGGDPRGPRPDRHEGEDGPHSGPGPRGSHLEGPGDEGGSSGPGGGGPGPRGPGGDGTSGSPPPPPPGVDSDGSDRPRSGSGSGFPGDGDVLP